MTGNQSALKAGHRVGGSDARMSRPTVSVIMIFLNAADFIQEAIESVFTQTYADWELLLVDDGSTDSSTTLALQYTQQCPEKVRYLEHEGHQNRGMSASRNLGISHARGEYVAFLDADDVWLPPKLGEQVAILDAHPRAAMVYGPGQAWYSWTGKPEDSRRDFVPSELSIPEIGLDTVVEPPALFPLMFRDDGVQSLPSGILVRRAVINQVGGFEASFRGMFEDLVFDAKVYLAAPVFVASKCWYRWRRHPESCCTVAMNTGQYDPAWLTFLSWLESYVSQQRINDRTVLRALHRALWPHRHAILCRLLGYSTYAMAQLRRVVKYAARRTLPVPVRFWLRAQQQRYRHRSLRV